MYDACIDVEGLKITVIEPDEPSLTLSEQDIQEMHDYYNEPETMPDEDKSNPVPAIVGVPLLDGRVAVLSTEVPSGTQPATSQQVTEAGDSNSSVQDEQGSSQPVGADGEPGVDHESTANNAS